MRAEVRPPLPVGREHHRPGEPGAVLLLHLLLPALLQLLGLPVLRPRASLGRLRRREPALVVPRLRQLVLPPVLLDVRHHHVEHAHLPRERQHDHQREHQPLPLPAFPRPQRQLLQPFQQREGAEYDHVLQQGGGRRPARTHRAGASNLPARCAATLAYLPPRVHRARRSLSYGPAWGPKTRAARLPRWQFRPPP